MLMRSVHWLFYTPLEYPANPFPQVQLVGQKEHVNITLLDAVFPPAMYETAFVVKHFAHRTCGHENFTSLICKKTMFHCFPIISVVEQHFK